MYKLLVYSLIRQSNYRADRIMHMQGHGINELYSSLLTDKWLTVYAIWISWYD